MINDEVHCARCGLVIWGQVEKWDTPTDACHDTADACIKALGQRLRELEERLDEHYHSDDGLVRIS